MKPKRVSVAEAKDRLPALIHETESSGAPVEITRRGKVVAVLLSSAEHERRSKPKEGFIEALARIRRRYREETGEELGFTKEEIATLRDPSPGRDFSFDKD